MIGWCEEKGFDGEVPMVGLGINPPDPDDEWGVNEWLIQNDVSDVKVPRMSSGWIASPNFWMRTI